MKSKKSEKLLKDLKRFLRSYPSYGNKSAIKGRNKSKGKKKSNVKK